MKFTFSLKFLLFLTLAVCVCLALGRLWCDYINANRELARIYLSIGIDRNLKEYYEVMPVGQIEQNDSEQWDLLGCYLVKISHPEKFGYRFNYYDYANDELSSTDLFFADHLMAISLQNENDTQFVDFQHNRYFYVHSADRYVGDAVDRVSALFFHGNTENFEEVVFIPSTS